MSLSDIIKIKTYFKKGACVLFIFFILIDIGIGAYIFTNTTREKIPSFSYSMDDIKLFETSSGAEAIVIGSGNKIFYIRLGDESPLWEYNLDSEVIWLSISANGKFIAASDENKNIYLLFKGTRNNPNLVFKYKLDSKVEGLDLYGIGEYFYVLRLVVATKNSIYIFSLNQEDPLWSYTLESEITVAEMPYNGKLIAVGTNSGDLYIFLTFKEKMLKKYSLASKITSISVSPYSECIFAGCENGSVFMFSVNGGLVWGHNLNSEIVLTSTSIKGRSSLLKTKDGKILTFDEDGGIVRTFENKDAKPFFSQWTSDIILIEGKNIRLFKKDRENPIWKYSEDNFPIAIRSDVSLDNIFIVYNDKFNLFTRDSIFILGSRRGWSFLAFLFIAQVLICVYVSRRSRIDINKFIRSGDFKVLVISVLIGGCLGFYFGYGLIKSYTHKLIFLIIITSIFSSWMYIKSEGGVSGILVSWVYGIFASIILGAFIGIFVWLGGIEQSIFSPIGLYMFIGGFVGIVVGIIAVLTAVIACFFYKQ